MTLEQLIVLNAIVEHGTFRAAASHLNKAQSAISHMMKKLEDEIGFELLSRDAYRPSLTERGEVIYRHATRVLQRVQELKSISATLRSDQEAEVALTVTATYPLPPILSLVSEMTARFQATHIKMSRDNMGGSLERLLAEDVQIAISTLDDVPLDRIEALPLRPVMMIPVSHPDFPAAQDDRMKSDTEMQTHIQVVVSDSARAATQSRGILPGGLRWTVSDFATKKEILLANMGWGGLPQHMIQAELDEGSLVPLNIEGYPPTRVSHYAMRRRDVTQGTVAQAIWDSLRMSKTQDA
ncbi:LysR family transcriptional regulator [Ruegeria pomeroyi]|uniref:LysR family transcriptional regulator n=1 Tax=Ruegeria pomeroyi TaxID=89184 RepID=A0A9Q3ZML2_9RHOB|nr:LysR family transcriptional regulator [Ruegeria pomeroyi]MCE8516854.1 LysR family transcriptional regulator [Ruegeria pomeroyi]MCE8538200.1 LysR family transcriptional regulator [Ruegeria pomeroyi]